MNTTFRKFHFKGPVMPLLNSGSWNPALHPRDPSNGEFVYTNGGLHGRPPGGRGSTSGKGSLKKSKKTPTFNIFHGIPPNSQTFTAPDGQTFLAPAGTDFRKIYEAGQTNGTWGIKAAVGHYGTYDFQRNGGAGELDANTFYPAYENASNYAVGVYMNGAGYSLGETHDIAEIYAMMRSLNFGSAAQAQWQTKGWNAAQAYHSK